jgi:hypothetical protein
LTWALRFPEQADAENQHEKCHEERGIEGKRKVPGRHEQRPRNHRDPTPGYPVADRAADDRSEVHQPYVEAERLRGERLYRQGTRDRFDARTKPVEANNLFNVAGEQQCVDHV